MLDRFAQFSTAISTIYRCVQKLEREEMVTYGYKGAFAQYLVTLNRHPEGLTLVELCDLCDKDKAAVSRMVGEMEEKDLVRRERKGDRVYKAVVKLTEEGRRAADFVATRACAAVAAVGKELSDSDRAVFYAALTAISTNLQALTKEGIPL
ncbi:MAG: MarR family transcriptional regulator [Clostridia bacterium]|nr:MarR family transcriptional regulator [Clostridia bacterium]